jgi:hypothetical protein
VVGLEAADEVGTTTLTLEEAAADETTLALEEATAEVAEDLTALEEVTVTLADEEGATEEAVDLGAVAVVVEGAAHQPKPKKQKVRFSRACSASTLTGAAKVVPDKAK